MGLPLQEQRFSGNLFQPNQTAFVFVVGVISTLYFFNNLKKYNLLKNVIIFFLSLGVALTVSRSGILLLIGSVLIFNLYSNYYENKKIYYLKDTSISIIGLLLGFFLYNKYSISENVIDRMEMSVDDPRLSLLYQSWLIFSGDPITGIGWKNFASGGLQYSDQIEGLIFADHSHFIFSQLLSEFGLLGLILIVVFFYIFIKNILYISNLREAYLFSILLVFIAYSCFEYPLWYLRYLFVFCIFFSLFDKSEKFFYKIEKGYLLSMVAFFLTFSSIYYIYQYNKLIYINAIIFDSKYSVKERTEKLIEMRPVFGFSYFNDLFVYQTMEVDRFLLTDKILIGERLVNYIPMNQYLIKQGALLAFDNQNKKALYYFKASCYYNLGKKCDSTKAYLKSVSLSNPRIFKDIYIEILKTNN
nr:O-antigen ligase family protein [Acinetobacter harbinensis]